MFGWRKKGNICELDYKDFKLYDGCGRKPLAPRARSAPPMAYKLFHGGAMFLYRQVFNVQL